MTITHIVMFEFKDSVDADTIKDVYTRFLALQHRCLHPTTKTPYILSCKGGRNNSPEAARAAYSHCFVLEFAGAEDRRWYLEEDPAHLGFVGSLSGVVEKVGVMDFEGGVF